MTVAFTTIRLRRRPRWGTVGASARRRDGQKILIPGVIRLTSTHQFPLLHEYSYFSRALRARFISVANMLCGRHHRRREPNMVNEHGYGSRASGECQFIALFWYLFSTHSPRPNQQDCPQFQENYRVISDIRWHLFWLSDPRSGSQRAPLTGLAPPEGKFRSTGSMTAVAANNWERIVRPDSAVQPQQPGKPR